MAGWCKPTLVFIFCPLVKLDNKKLKVGSMYLQFHLSIVGGSNLLARSLNMSSVESITLLYTIMQLRFSLHAFISLSCAFHWKPIYLHPHWADHISTWTHATSSSSQKTGCCWWVRVPELEHHNPSDSSLLCVSYIFLMDIVAILIFSGFIIGFVIIAAEDFGWIVIN